ncbi:MAG: sirohydrochlorin cobaltochelatase [Roseburia sp.]
MTGILVVSFGTTYQETREKNIEKIVEEVKDTYVDIPVYQAYSSNIVRKVLRERDHIWMDDFNEAFERMHKDGITKVKVLPTHIIDGIENSRLNEVVKSYRGWFESIEVARPLLGEEKDYEKAAECLLRELAEEDALLLMGHGSTHEADKSYQKMEQVLKEKKKNTYLATVEGTVGFEDVLPQIEKEVAKGSRVLVTPFMLVAGDHANNDMAGEEEDSFASRLRSVGYQPDCLIRGIGEYESIRKLYLTHLKEIM